MGTVSGPPPEAASDAPAPTSPADATASVSAVTTFAGNVSNATVEALDESTLSADTVAAKVDHEYLTEIRRCYAAELAKDATARGKVSMSFTIDERGHVFGLKPHSFTNELDTCISNTTKSWVFPIPKDADGDATDAMFQLSLQMLPT